MWGREGVTLHTDISPSGNELYRDLVVGSASDPLMDRFSWSMEEVCSHWNWTPVSGFLKKEEEFSLT